MIGSLLYLISSRPDIIFSTCLYARFQSSPRESYLNDFKRIFKYLSGSLQLALCYPRSSSFDLISYSDADFAGSLLDRKSTSKIFQFQDNIQFLGLARNKFRLPCPLLKQNILLQVYVVHEFCGKNNNCWTMALNLIIFQSNVIIQVL